jgi:hypothetical protein
MAANSMRKRSFVKDARSRVYSSRRRIVGHNGLRCYTKGALFRTIYRGTGKLSRRPVFRRWPGGRIRDSGRPPVWWG